MKEELIYLNKEYIKYRESLGKNPRKPLKGDKEFLDWVKYRNEKFPKSEYIEIASNIMQRKPNEIYFTQMV